MFPNGVGVFSFISVYCGVIFYASVVADLFNFGYGLYGCNLACFISSLVWVRVSELLLCYLIVVVILTSFVSS